MIYKSIDIEAYKKWFCNFHSTTMEALQGVSQVDGLVELRICFSAILLEHKVSETQIGKLLNRDHSTISYYLYKRIRNEHDIKLQDLLIKTYNNFYLNI